jgi:glycosyltransferase involved in cell wall biosynthesis
MLPETAMVTAMAREKGRMGTVKVGIVAAEMEGPSTGVGRYLQGLLTGLGSWDNGVECHLFFQGEPDRLSVSLPGSVLHHAGDSGSRVVWEHLKLPSELRQNGLDVLLCPAYTMPFNVRIPTVVCLHDLSFEFVPRDFRFRERWRRRLLARRAARLADRVVCDTDHMAALVAETYQVPDDRMAVIPLGVDRGRFGPRPSRADTEPLEQLGVRSPYVLWLGTVLERRRPREVLEAFATVRSEGHDLQLVIAGANRMRSPYSLERWIRDFGLEADTLRLGWVDETALAPLYRGAAAAVYVSRHEGFGLPPLECLACGTPVVVSTGLALDTAWPDYPFRCEDTSSPAISAALRRAVSTTGWEEGFSAQARHVLDTFDWKVSSKLLVAELERVAGR